MMLYMSIKLSGLVDAAFPRPHFQKQGGEDHVVMVAWWNNGLGLFKHDTKASSDEFCFPY